MSTRTQGRVSGQLLLYSRLAQESHITLFISFFFLFTMECQSVIAIGKYWCLDTMNIHAKCSTTFRVCCIQFNLHLQVRYGPLRSAAPATRRTVVQGRAGRTYTVHLSPEAPAGQFSRSFCPRLHIADKGRHTVCSCGRMQRECVSIRRNSCKE